jgi:cobalt/nickel transport system permease protein
MSDRHAHASYVHGHSRVHALPAHTKLVALLIVIVAVVATPRERVGFFAVHALVIIAAAASAQLGPRFIGGRLLIGAPFLAFALMLPFVGGGDRVVVGALSLSVGGIWGAWSVLVKGTLALTASIVVTATTPVPELLAGLGRLRVPVVITEIAGFMVRYLEVIAGEMQRTKVAMAARGYQPRWAWQGTALATSAGALFIRSHERGERVYDAMLSRGYQGRLPQLDATAATSAEWVRALALPLCAVAAATFAVIA